MVKIRNYKKKQLLQNRFLSCIEKQNQIKEILNLHSCNYMSHDISFNMFLLNEIKLFFVCLSLQFFQPCILFSNHKFHDFLFEMEPNVHQLYLFQWNQMTFEYSSFDVVIKNDVALLRKNYC